MHRFQINEIRISASGSWIWASFKVPQVILVISQG